MQSYGQHTNETTIDGSGLELWKKEEHENINYNNVQRETLDSQEQKD